MARKHRFCPNVLITCVDPRLHQRPDGSNFVAEFTREFIKGDCILITRGGGVKHLFHVIQGLNVSLKMDMEIGSILHDAEKIHMLGHEDCLGYGEHGFFSREEEFRKQMQDMEDASHFIRRELSFKESFFYFADLADPVIGKFSARQIG